MHIERKLNDFMGNLFGKAYYKMLVKWKLWKGRPHNPILVWQMGKVGSSSVTKSLHERLPGTPIFHLHVLSEKLIKSGEMYARSMLNKDKAYLYNEAIRDSIQQNNINYKWRIITLVREPIGRNLSAYFQNLYIFFANDFDKKKNTLNKPILEEVMETFINKFDHDKPMCWFDEEIKGILGIDVFAEPFPVDEGYKIYSNENYDILLIRMESLDARVKKAIHEYLDLDDFELIKTNIGSDKGYSVLYSQVKENIRLPNDYLDRLLSSKYTLQFYSVDEIEKIRSKWKC